MVSINKVYDKSMIYLLESAKIEPNGLKEDERATNLGIQYTIPVMGKSTYPKDRKFTLGANERLKTPNVKFMKSNTERTPSGNLRITDPTGWYMSEKLDGLRALWDGSVMISSSGSIPFFVPEWLKEILPPGVCLDGEIWAGRDQFSGKNGVSGIFSIKPGPKASYSLSDAHLKWLEINYCVFDLPTLNENFSERVEVLEKLVNIREEYWPKIKEKYYQIYRETMPKVAEKIMTTDCPIKFAEQTLIKDSQHFQEVFQNVISKKGEGLILRKKNSKYEGKRSNASLKFKQIDDAECRVIEIIPGTIGSKYDRVVKDMDGKEYPVLGAIRCIRTDALGNPVLKDGREIEFKIGTGFSDEFRENYWNSNFPDYYIFNYSNGIGAIITFTYMKINTDTGTPREPRFMRIRIPIVEQIKENNLTPTIPTTAKELKYRLIRDFSIIKLVAKLKGDNGIGNRKRIQTYENAIDIIKDEIVLDDDEDKNTEFKTIDDLIKYLDKELTKAPQQKMEQILKNGFIKIDKEPYNGVIVVNGIVDNKELQEKVDSIILLEPLMTAKVGLGSARVQELMDMGYKSIEMIEKSYRNDQSIGKAIRKGLDKYFEGYSRNEERMSWDDANQWRTSIVKLIREIGQEYPQLKGTMCGSYARREKTVGDIDYVLSHPELEKLYNVMKYIQTRLESGKFLVNGKKVTIEKIDEYPKEPTDKLTDFIPLKVWGSLNRKSVKVEFYGYVQSTENFIFSKLARSATVDFQKKIRYTASKMGYSLSDRGLKNRITNKLLKVGDKEIIDKLDKDYFEDYNDIYKFLNIKV